MSRTQLDLTSLLKGEGEHKRSKQFYPRVRKGDHVRGIARHVYRERTLFRAKQMLKHKKTAADQHGDSELETEQNVNTLNIPLDEEEILDPTPPEQHHHISKDVRHKVDVLKWLADNRNDPALKVSSFCLAINPNLMVMLEFPSSSQGSSPQPLG